MSRIAKFNTAFKPVHECKKRYVVLKGGAGSGKSVDTAQFYILRLMSQPGRNLMCMRKSEMSNRNSTFAVLEGAIKALGVSEYWEINRSPMQMKCKNGATIIFRGMNDARQREKIKSVTFAKGSLTDIWLEEATEFTQEDVEILDDRLRGKLPEGLFYQMKLTFNPVSANHWIKKVYFDRKDSEVFTHSTTYLDNAFCDKAYHKRMQRRKKLDPQGYAVYALGEWGETRSNILNNWEVREIDTNPDSYDSAAIGQDFGFNHANVLLTVGFRDGDIYVLNEIYTKEKDTQEIIAVAEKSGVSKRLIMYCDSAEPDRIRTWKTAGYRAIGVRKEKGSVLSQIDFLKTRRIFVHPSCKNLIRELRDWRWQQDGRSGDYLDEPASGEDDAIAAMRYAVEGERKSRRMIGVRI